MSMVTARLVYLNLHYLHHLTKSNTRITTKDEEKVILKIQKHLKQLRAIDDELDNHEGKELENLSANRCFITFNQQEGVKRARSLYPNSTLNWMFQRSSLRLKNQRISLRKAPHPEDIFWENLEQTRKSSTRKQILTSLLTIFVLCFSFSTALYSKGQRELFSRKYPTTNCVKVVSLNTSKRNFF